MNPEKKNKINTHTVKTLFKLINQIVQNHFVKKARAKYSVITNIYQNDDRKHVEESPSKPCASKKVIHWKNFFLFEFIEFYWNFISIFFFFCNRFLTNSSSDFRFHRIKMNNYTRIIHSDAYGMYTVNQCSQSVE